MRGRQGVPPADRARGLSRCADRAGARYLEHARRAGALRPAAARARSARRAGSQALDFGDEAATRARRSMRHSSRFRRWWRPSLRARPRRRRPRSARSSTRISASTPPAELSAMIGVLERHHRMALRLSRTGSRSRSAAPTGCSISRARNSPRRSGGRSRKSPACAATCRPGRSCASAARPSRRRRRRTPSAPVLPRQFANLYLAGDWTDTGLPATIEGAIRSGNRAADLALRSLSSKRHDDDRHDDRHSPAVALDKLDPRWSGTSARATDALLADQQPDGHWVFELEADATIPAEYVLMVHYFAEPPNLELERKIGVYLRRIQGAHGGWPLFHEGDFDMSASVKAYFALKMIGDDIDADHMRRAREAILSRGGAVKSQRVHPRAALALRRDPVEQRAGDAGRDHAAAEVVSVPPRQDLVLGAHRDRAAAGAAGAEAEGDQSARRHDRRAVPPGPEDRRRAAQGAAPEVVLVPRRSAPSTSCCARSSRSCRRACASARSTRRSRSSPSGSTASTGSARSTRRWKTR